MAQNTRTNRPARPALEHLEDRKLLNARTIAPNGLPISDVDLKHFQNQKANGNVPVADRRFLYTTPEGTKVVVTLYGPGSLAGTTFSTAGALDLIYANTDATSKIIGHTSGGTHRAFVSSIRNINIPPRSSASTGSTQLNVVNFKQFDLADDGYVNLNGGVGTVYFNKMGRNSQMHLKALPTAAELAAAASSAAGSVSGLGQSTGLGGGQVVGVNTGGAVATGSSVNAGPPKPTGVDVLIPNVEGASLGTPPLGPPQVFSVDTVTHSLLRFNTSTGDATLTIPLPPMSTATPSIGLGRDPQHLVVLAADGTTVYGFDAVTGVSRGSFSTASLASIGFTGVNGIGSSDTRTLLESLPSDPNAPAGVAVRIDVTESLASGTVVTIGSPFRPDRELTFRGGATGLAGVETLYAIGAAHFDSFQPNLKQFGVIDLVAKGKGFTELSRTALKTSTGAFINAGTDATPTPNPFSGMGSVDSDLAFITGLDGSGHNTVEFRNPTTLAKDGTGITLNDPNPLAGLSESFHPEILDAALINVQGNLKSFRAKNAHGLVINDSGKLNFVGIHDAVDVAVYGRPLEHVEIPLRTNVQLISTARGPLGVGTRGGVTVSAALRPAGPLTLP